MTIDTSPLTAALQSIKDSVSETGQNKSPPHTPGPYFHNDNGLITAAPVDPDSGDPDSGDYIGIADTASQPGMENDQDKANADFIARACNNHYELLEALEEIVWKLSHNGGETKETSKPVSITRLDITIKNAVIAVAKARGEG